jgi:hypothetical protein
MGITRTWSSGAALVGGCGRHMCEHKVDLSLVVWVDDE